MLLLKKYWDHLKKIWKKFRSKSIWLRIDRTMSESFPSQLLYVGGFLFISLVAFWGVTYNLTIDNRFGEDWWDKLLFGFYLLFDTNALSTLVYGSENQPVNMDILAPATIISILGVIFFGGLLISLVTTWLSRRIDDYKSGRTCYLRNGHSVILGYDEIVPSIILKICQDNPEANILLQSTMHSDFLREMLQRSPANSYCKQIIINYGHRTSKEDLKHLHLADANDIYIVGDRSKSTHDSMNIECLVHIYELLVTSNTPRPSKITCVIEDADTYTSLQKVELFNRFRKIDINPVFYNFYSEWARQIFVNKSYGKDFMIGKKTYHRNYLDVDLGGIKHDDNRIAHIVIIGVNRFGVSIGVEAAKILHFPNYINNKTLKTKITFIDKKADEEREQFMTRYRSFFEIQSCYYYDMTHIKPKMKIYPPSKYKKEQSDFLDVDFEFIKGDIFTSQIQNLLRKWSNDINQQVSIFIALKDQQKGFSIALNLPYELYYTQSAIFVRQTRSDFFITQLRHEESMDPKGQTDNKEDLVGITSEWESGIYQNLAPFGMTDVTCEILPTTLLQAQLYAFFDKYSDFRMQAAKNNYDTIDWKPIIQSARTEWKHFSIDDQCGYIYRAYSIPYILNTLRAKRGLAPIDHSLDFKQLTNEEVEYLVQTEPNRWNVEKLLSGYRKGDVDFEVGLDVNEIIFRENGRLKTSAKIRPNSVPLDISPQDKEMVALLPNLYQASIRIKC